MKSGMWSACACAGAVALMMGLMASPAENLIFRTIERNTVQKWGTQS